MAVSDQNRIQVQSDLIHEFQDENDCLRGLLWSAHEYLPINLAEKVRLQLRKPKLLNCRRNSW